MKVPAIPSATAVLAVWWSVLAGCASAQPASDDHANHEQPGKELVVFLSAEAHNISSSGSTETLNEDAWFAADIVLALTRDRFRLFGEYLLTTEEHDLERFQLGYELVPNTLIWLGRYHQPASAWNTEHHHGRYLQTSVTRPSVELWEDEQGIVPQHIAGLLVDSRRPLGESAGLQVSVGAGLGPRIEEGKLEAFDLVDPHESGRHVSWTARLAYLPDYAGQSSFGLVAAHHRIPVVDGSIVNLPQTTEVQQDVYGAFINWYADQWKVVAVVYDIRIDLRGPGTSRREHFVAGYLEADRQLPNGFTAFGRIEDSGNARNSTYLAGNYPDFELRRFIAGLRWDVRPRHAITLELARGETIRARQNEVRLQWSAAVP